MENKIWNRVKSECLEAIWISAELTSYSNFGRRIHQSYHIVWRYP